MLYHLSYSRSAVVGRGGFEPPKALRQQIYSLPRLATSVPAHDTSLNEHPYLLCQPYAKFTIRSWRRDSNPQPAHYK